MTEQAERISDGADTVNAHILADLHDLRAAVAELCAAVSRVDQTLAELAPAARRAAAMLDNPVTSYLAARKEANADAVQQVPRQAAPRVFRKRRVVKTGPPGPRPQNQDGAAGEG